MKNNISVPLFDLKKQHELLKEDLFNAYTRCLDHGKFIMGPEVEECEQNLSQFCGAKYSITCSSGTDALRLALMALNIGPGDEVITTAFTFIATVEMILAVGAKPVLVDIDPVTYNIDPTKVIEAVTEKTKAVIAVSLFGRVSPLNALKEILKPRNVYLIEDAAQSFGAKESVNGISCKSADISTTSFFPAKPLGCLGDGGALFTDNEEWAQKIKRLRVHGSAKKYFHTEVGIGGRMDSLQCGFLNGKLSLFPNEIKLRNQIAQKYFEGLKDLESIQLPSRLKDNEVHTWAQFTLKHEKRDEVISKMKEYNVSCSIHYPRTVNQQPGYKGTCQEFDLTCSQEAAEKVFSLPMHPYLNEDQVDHTINSLQKVLESF